MDTKALHMHRTPGRLRVRCPQLKYNPAQAHEAKCRLAQLHGVRSVHLNALTGSLLIHFDPKASTAEVLLEVVFSSRPKAVAPSAWAPVLNAPPTRSQAGCIFAKAALAYVGERAFEHMISVVIAALL